MLDGNTFFGATGMPIEKMARVSTRLADWLPEPLTVAAWNVRSLMICPGVMASLQSTLLASSASVAAVPLAHPESLARRWHSAAGGQGAHLPCAGTRESCRSQGDSPRRAARGAGAGCRPEAEGRQLPGGDRGRRRRCSRLR